MKQIISTTLLLGLLAGCCVQSSAPLSPEPHASTTPPAPASQDGAASGETGEFLAGLDASGVYLITPGQLQEMGLAPGLVSAENLRLSRRLPCDAAGVCEEQPVPWLPVAMQDGTGMLFYAEVLPSRHSPYGTYRLTLGQPGTTMTRREETAPTGTAAADAAWASVTQENDLRYQPQNPSGDPWLDEPLFAPGTRTYPVELEHTVPHTASLRIWLWSATADPVEPDHHLRLLWNGQLAAEERWEGQGMREIVVDLPAGSTIDGENTLELAAPGDTGANAEVVFVDRWQLTYRRALVAEGDALAWTAETDAYALDGFRQSPGWLLDVTDPLQPQWAELEMGSGPMQVATQTGHHYTALSADGALSALWLRPVDDGDLRAAGAGADYLVLAAPVFHAALQPLLEHRQAQGLLTRLVDPQHVYDGWGDGLPNPDAIAAFFAYTQAQWEPAPRFLLVVGDASYDTRDYYAEGGNVLIPAAFIRTAFVGETASEVSLVSPGTDGPAAAVGRWPVRTPEDVQALVRKTIAYENTPADEHTLDQLVVADDESDFQRFAAELRDHWAAAQQRTELIDAGDGQARDRLLATLETGVRWTHYVGHGSVRIWGDEGLLTDADGDAWQRPSVFVTWTCLNGFFLHPQANSLMEALLRDPHGGAVAALAPVGETLLTDQIPLAWALYTEMERQPTLGEALAEAQRQVLADGSSSQEVIETYVLLGDPALRIGE